MFGGISDSKQQAARRLHTSRGGPMAQNPDLFDVEALERSLNDSSTRVSTIWISFLIFGLYLVVAAGAVTYRQLLLEGPVKLPALNVDLPLVGFFFLTPILFVIFHTYVLIQVLLLARTAAAYNNVLDRTVRVSTDNAAMRQRLANTVFAQIFAGSPRERGGWLGLLLRLIAWLTLAIAPVLVLLVFQFKFLPYHSHLITWALRLLILLDLIGLLVLWRAARRPDRDLTWRLIFQGRLGWLCAFALAVFSWVALTFPGESHAKWTRFLQPERLPGQAEGLPECQTLSPLHATFPCFDRFSLWGLDVVDTAKLAKMQKARVEWALAPRERKYLHNFSHRDLNCANLSSADLRRVDLSRARLRGALLPWADLESANLEWADLQGADLHQATLNEAHLYSADLRNAFIESAELMRANLVSAQLQGASLKNAQLYGAELTAAGARGADFSNARLEGASLLATQLQGASLEGAYLQLAHLNGAELQGADLRRADLSGARLDAVGLQGADLSESAMRYSSMFEPRVWRAKIAACTDAIISREAFDARVPLIQDEGRLVPSLPSETVPATVDNIATLIDKSVAGISDPKRKQAAIDRMRSGLIADATQDDATAIEALRRCGRADFGKQSVAFLRQLFCDTKNRVCARDPRCDVKRSVNAVAKQTINRLIAAGPSSLSAQLAQGMLGEDGECAASRELDEENKARLREVIAAPNHN